MTSGKRPSRKGKAGGKCGTTSAEDCKKNKRRSLLISLMISSYDPNVKLRDNRNINQEKVFERDKDTISDHHLLSSPHLFVCRYGYLPSLFAT